MIWRHGYETPILWNMPIPAHAIPKISSGNPLVILGGAKGLIEGLLFAKLLDSEPLLKMRWKWMSVREPVPSEVVPPEWKEREILCPDLEFWAELLYQLDAEPQLAILGLIVLDQLHLALLGPATEDAWELFCTESKSLA